MTTSVNTTGIDETKPESGNATTQAVRDNFDEIKLQLGNAGSDITALQNDKLGAVNTLSDLQSKVTTRYADGDTVRMRGRNNVGDGGEGHFRWDSSDLSIEVGNDEMTAGEGDGGIYIAPASDKSGASGAWVRQFINSVSPLWYGAAWDGATDDGAAIQKVLDYLSNNVGGLLELPSGTGITGQKILQPSFTTIRGQGVGATVLQLANGSDATIIENSDTTNGNDKCFTYDLTLDGNKSNNTGDIRCLLYRRVRTGGVDHVEAQNSNRDGIRAVNVGHPEEKKNMILSNIWAHDNVGTGVVGAGAQRRTMYSNIQSHNNAEDGIRLDHSEGLGSNLHASQNSRWGIFIRNTKLLDLVNLQATLNGQHGIFVTAWTEAAGANWTAGNNGTSSTNTYDNIYWDDDSTLSYGITKHVVVNGIYTAQDFPSEPGDASTNHARYGMYFENGFSNLSDPVNIYSARIRFGQSGGTRLPPSPYGNLVIEDIPPDGQRRMFAGNFLVDQGSVAARQFSSNDGGVAVQIADDSFVSFPIVGLGIGSYDKAMIVVTGGVPGDSGLFWAQAQSGGSTTTGFSIGANVELTTGDLTGTTGTDGKVTYSAHTDGRIYIENRSGASRKFAWSVLGGGGGF